MAHRRLPLRLLLALVAVPAAAGALAAQETVARRAGAAPPTSYLLAQASLEAGDTAAAVAYLRQAVVESRRYAPAHLLLGSLLAQGASEIEREFAIRMEAERHLMQALRLMGPDPDLIAEFGLLMRKQGRRADARRVLERALGELERLGREVPPERRAEMHYALGRLYEGLWRPADGERVMTNPAFDAAAACLNMPLSGSMAMAALYCPVEFWRALPLLASIAHRRTRYRERTFGHFRSAIRYDPAYLGAAVRLLTHLADAEEWSEYEQVARQLTLVLPEDPTGYLWLGVRLHGRGQAAAADSLFSRGLALMPPDKRRAYEDVETLLTRRARQEYRESGEEKRAEMARIFFTAKDPLYLTDANERRLEHLARVAWADLRYAAPGRGVRGYETERGDIWIRYGPPARMIRNIWSYGETGPNFVFGGQLARHVSQSKGFDDDLRASSPERYHPRTITEFIALPHQTAAFRGPEPGRLVLEVYGLVDAPRLQPPADSAAAAEPAPRSGELEAGLFLFDALYHPLWNSKGRFASTAERPVALTYRVDLGPGSYRYGLEARMTGPDSVPRPAARARHEIELPDLWGGALAISDLLLAESVTASVPEPRRRSDLAIVPRRSVQVGRGAALEVYFEIYGLESDAGGSARYEAELVVENASRRNVAQRALRGLQRLAGRAPAEPRLRWERTASPVDDTVVEYLRVELSDPAPGPYSMRLSVTDLATGERVERTRWLQLMP